MDAADGDNGPGWSAGSSISSVASRQGSGRLRAPSSAGSSAAGARSHRPEASPNPAMLRPNRPVAPHGRAPPPPAQARAPAASLLPPPSAPPQPHAARSGGGPSSRKQESVATRRVKTGMKIKTNTPVAKKGREGVMEFLLMNHPLDCLSATRVGSATSRISLWPLELTVVGSLR